MERSISYMDIPQQLFLMYYLVDTRIENGCLRVIAGSHRKRHRMHDAVPTAHTDELRRATDPSHPVYQPMAEDQAVPVRAGDLVIGDSRLLHGSFANQSGQRRTVITLWYHPIFDTAPPRIQAHLSNKQSRVSEWPLRAQEIVQRLVPSMRARQSRWSGIGYRGMNLHEHLNQLETFLTHKEKNSMKMHIGGQWVDKSEKIEVLHPFDGSVIDTIPRGDAADVELALATAERGAKVMAKMTGYERYEILRRAADLMVERTEIWPAPSLWRRARSSLRAALRRRARSRSSRSPRRRPSVWVGR